MLTLLCIYIYIDRLPNHRVYQNILSCDIVYVFFKWLALVPGREWIQIDAAKRPSNRGCVSVQSRSMRLMPRRFAGAGF